MKAEHVLICALFIERQYTSTGLLLFYNLFHTRPWLAS